MLLFVLVEMKLLISKEGFIPMIREANFKTSVSKVVWVSLVIIAKFSSVEAGVVKSLKFIFAVISVVTKLLLS